ncbi:GntR family transcriptional regulator [Bacillus haikouensis]|jgi:DNA-binding GntR family transcriptional regulator|uniref:GntR family transcriptional regulator n=1 Tax=Bacillus haikouensis TaxID=1510468 RepID=UPI001557E709|nr:GntR family transcriptional regulator [Bacillus haikouensis]NQD68308.1 GntR family transcriptional regulator [Bacillus haikouensis]
MDKFNLKPVQKKKTTKEIVYEQVKKAVLNGTIGKDEVLTETLLADKLETSRTPVREAVADLTKDGLLVHIPRKGFKVRRITENEKEQIIFLRVSIETEGLRKLVGSVKEEQIDLLRGIISSQEMAMKENDRVQYIELDQLFHRKILEFADQNLLEQILLELYNLARLIGHQALMKEGRMEEVIKEHNDILNALEAKDSEKALELMNKHLQKTRETVKAVEKQ